MARTYKVSGSVVPDSETFEHNNLTGQYGGETGAFSIQTGTVSEGSYALFGDGEANSQAIVRDTAQEAWGPSVNGDLKITAKRWFETSSNVGSGGIFIGCQSVTGYGSLSGYYFYTNADNDSITIRRVDNGSSTTLATNGSAGLNTNSWVNEEIIWRTDGTIKRTTDATTITATDSTYTEGYLGFASYRDDYWDNIQFEAI